MVARHQALFCIDGWFWDKPSSGAILCLYLVNDILFCYRMSFKCRNPPGFSRGGRFGLVKPKVCILHGCRNYVELT
jgi:hypothetical protein